MPLQFKRIPATPLLIFLSLALVLAMLCIPNLSKPALAAGVFSSPTSGFIGYQYNQPIGGGGVHAGIDIWSSKNPGAAAPGNPVYSV